MALNFQIVKRRNPQKEGVFVWLGEVKHDKKIITLAGLAKHMAEHNTPYSKGLIKGILTDMVTCIKEMALEGRKIKIDDLAIFSLKVKSKSVEDPKEWTVAKHVTNVHLNARATGEFSIENLKEATLVENDDYISPRRDNGGDTGDDGTGGDNTGDDGTGGTGTGGTGGGEGSDSEL